jgi:sn-glycerol 3-phosphate transport system permease protein
LASVPSTRAASPADEQGPATRSQLQRYQFGPRERHDFLVFIAFALPNIVLIVAFSYRPVLSNIYYSTLNWTLGSANATAVGFGNYVQ